MPDSENAFPIYRGKMQYLCLGCNNTYSTEELYYTCPNCGGVFLLEDLNFDELRQTSSKDWQKIFDYRCLSRNSSLRGIFRFYELIAPVLEEQDILYLGEGNTPIIPASNTLSHKLKQKFAYKNDGQNPSASFKDRGMACAFSYLQNAIRQNNWSEVLTICASTGDTSAAAALYAAYIGNKVKSVVILPQGKVTPEQLSQPLGNGATVIEVPGVFDDCMKIVEYLAENYRVALLNSKNAWRILGQESYAFEIAQWYNWNLENKVLFVPIGNAGNITAILAGLLKLYNLNIITKLPRIFGVQSEHANPVFKFYSEPNLKNREFKPVQIKASVAQAAMIGNPVSFPRVKYLVEKYEQLAGADSFNVIEVCEQAIIEAMLEANKHGHIACTQGGECLAGLLRAKELNKIDSEELAILDATAHSLKFAGFQAMYFNNSFPAEYGICPKPELKNSPKLIGSEQEKINIINKDFIVKAASDIAVELKLKPV